LLKHVIKCYILVGGIPTPLKNMKVSWDNDSQYIYIYGKIKKCSKRPTSIYIYIHPRGYIYTRHIISIQDILRHIL
jgi:hypothetical protein